MQFEATRGSKTARIIIISGESIPLSECWQQVLVCSSSSALKTIAFDCQAIKGKSMKVLFDDMDANADDVVSVPGFPASKERVLRVGSDSSPTSAALKAVSDKTV